MGIDRSAQSYRLLRSKAAAHLIPKYLIVVHHHTVYAVGDVGRKYDGGINPHTPELHSSQPHRARKIELHQDTAVKQCVEGTRQEELRPKKNPPMAQCHWRVLLKGHVSEPRSF